MNRFVSLISLLAFCLPATSASAQSPDELSLADEPSDGGRILFGGFGHGSFTPMMVNYSGTDEFTTDGALGEDASPVGFGMAFGGGGKAIIGGFVLGGYGFALPELSGTSEAGAVDFSGGGGGLQLGWAFCGPSQMLVYPYLGFGGAGVKASVVNNSDAAITIGDSTSIDPGRRREFGGGFVYGDVGLGWVMFNPGLDGGFLVGAETGVFYTLSGGAWEDLDGNAVPGLGDTGIVAGYLRINIGGGGFSED